LLEDVAAPGDRLGAMSGGTLTSGRRATLRAELLLSQPRPRGQRWLAALLVGSIAWGTSVARAEEIKPGGKAMVGGVLLGAEVVVIAESLIGIEPWWAYLLGGGLGAGAGSLLGYAGEESGSGGVAVGLLTLGALLVIPATIAVVHGTRYRPPKDELTSTQARTPRAPLAVAAPTRPHAFFSIDMQAPLRTPSVTLGVPTVQVRERVTAMEVAFFGAKQGAQFDVPVLDVRF
jgi:hypothetical protein